MPRQQQRLLATIADDEGGALTRHQGGVIKTCVVVGLRLQFWWRGRGGGEGMG